MDTQVFEALADENRLAIVTLLASRGELCVCDVSGSLGISNALASHHLKKLREAGLVSTRRDGSWLHCRLEHDVLGDIAAQLATLAERSDATPGVCCGPRESAGGSR